MRLARWLVGPALAASTACAPPAPQVPVSEVRASSPLGPSYVLLPLPSDDDSPLGRVVTAPPADGHALEEMLAPNPCAEHLEAAKRSAQAASFEDAQELAFGVHAKATLSTFGFAADAERATHFVYRVETTARVGRVDTTAYRACCEQKGCGYGFVTALVAGEGEYATAEESSVKGGANVALASASGDARLKILHRRKVRGYIAALVQVTDPKKGAALGALGLAQQAGITEESLPDTMRKLYEREKAAVVGDGPGYTFTIGGHTVTENEFARRYGAATGASDLVPRRRNVAGTVTLGALTAVSAGFLVYGLSQLPWVRAKGYCGEFACSATFFSAIGVASFGSAFAWTLASTTSVDGYATDHDVSVYDAQLAVLRYNRALLRKASKDVVRNIQSRRAGPSTRDGIALDAWPGGLVVRAQF